MKDDNNLVILNDLMFQLPIGISSNNDEDSCQAIVGLKIVNGDDCDTILVSVNLSRAKNVLSFRFFMP